AANAEDRDKVAGSEPAVAQGVERGNARAQQGCSLCGRQFVRHRGQRLERHDRVVRIAAVIRDSRDLPGRAGDEIASAAGPAMTAVTAIPADADTLTRLPLGHVGAERIYH